MTSGDVTGGLQIRAGRDEDAGGFIDLIGACWREYSNAVFDIAAEVPEVWALASHTTGRGGALWTAERGGRIVGMISVYPAAELWMLARVYVDGAERGTGLAQDLLHLAEGHARDSGAARIMLWSDVLFVRAHAFYEKHGYLRRGGLRTVQELSGTVIEAGYAKPLAGLVVEELDVAAAESAERPLAGLLRDCVNDGASVSFLLPLAREKAAAFWRSVTRRVGQNEVRLFAAWMDGTLAGTVQLALDMPENQGHRGDIRKLLVAPAMRRRGVAAALMRAAEAAAATSGRRLLVLDTLADSSAEQLYRGIGWIEAGTIPGYALDEHGQGHATRFFYKAL